MPATLSLAQTDGGRIGQLNSFLDRYCIDCHSGDTTKGGLDLEELSKNLADAEVRRRWVFLHDRVAGGEMPPKDKKRPDTEVRSEFLATLGGALTQADLSSREVILRRLNRDEYQHTVRDLFGIFVDLNLTLPDDSTEQGFDNIGSTLALSAEQMATYLEAADLVLDRVFGPVKEPRRIKLELNMKDSRALSSSDPRTDEGAKLFSRRRYSIWETSVPGPGHYRFRFRVKAIQTEEPIVVNVWNGNTGAIPPHPARFFLIPPGEMTTIELTDWSPESSDNVAIEMPHGYSQYKVPDNYAGRGLFVGDIEVEGPLEEWPPKSRARLLGDVDPQNGTIEDSQAILLRLLPRAFRRQVNDSEVDRYVRLTQQGIDEGLAFDQALRRGLKGVLCAPEFLFLEEPAAVDDFTVAARLSYFLWSSMPDDELFDLAARGDLLKPDVLRAQTERMLADEKSHRFVESFTGQWLRLRDIDFTVPDRLVYPEYNQLIRRGMLDETRAFFREILGNDLSVQTFIDSDFLMINQPLADFYGIDGVRGLEIRRVELPEDHVRGGVLTQASVLKVSADGTRTSPVLRGVWILKHLYGTPSPPPPPNVAAVEPDIRGATTIREQLAKHREHQSCNRCHVKIDPPGFALEGFDVIGSERSWYRVRGRGKYIEKKQPNSPVNVQYRQGPDVDTTGLMPDGRPFAGIREYKELLLKDKTAMAQSLTHLLLSYSLGRDLGFSDRAEVERIVANLKSANYGLRSLIHEIVQSETFRSP